MLSTLLLVLAQSAAAPPARVLVYTESAGYVHAVAQRPPDGGPCPVERAWLDWDQEDPRFEVVASRDAGNFREEILDGFDAVFFYTSGELPIPPEGRRALLDFVREGGGLAGAHCASTTFLDWPEYSALLGGSFDGHPWHEEVAVRVEDAAHPATDWLGEGFSITDEIYQFRDPYSRERNRVLLSLDPGSVDLEKPEVRREDRDFALAWAREEGRGRVFYTALGHRPEVWEDPRFRHHLVEGTLWTAGGRAAAGADHLLLVSVDGLRGDVITFGGPERLPNLHRLLSGSGTLNARTDPDSTVTLPNHVGMLTGRLTSGDGGHRWTWNEDPRPGETLHSVAGEYVAGIFDVAHDHGVRTAMLVGKSKFSVFRDSWGAALGAPDRIGVDQGANKIDEYRFDTDSRELTARAIQALRAAPRTLVFVHYRDPDAAGHGDAWRLHFEAPYWRAVRAIDRELGRVFTAIEADPGLRGRTAVILTADHGGGAPDWNHTRRDMWMNYAIPFLVWPGSGVDLYTASASRRRDPGITQPGWKASPPPVRNSDAAEIALQLLGLVEPLWKL